MKEKHIKPTVSVLSITYNHGPYIEQMLKSVLAQKTDFKIELIIHDDASTDDTAAIIRKYETKYPDIIKPIYETENQYSKGPYDFINNMFKQAKGKYLAFCEGDDFWIEQNKLQAQVDFMEDNTNYALCFHPVRVFFENNEEPPQISPDVDDDYSYTTTDLLRGNVIYTNSVMYRAQKYDALPNNVMPQDWYLHLYHASFGPIGFLNKPMAAHRRHPGGVWWESYTNVDMLWKKFGLSYLRLYKELLKIDTYQASVEYHGIIDESIISMFNTLRRLDREQGTHLLKEAYEEFPEFAEVFAHHDYKTIVAQQTEAQTLAGKVKRLEEELSEQAALIHAITNSKTWKLKTAGHKASRVWRHPAASGKKAAQVIKKRSTQSKEPPV